MKNSNKIELIILLLIAVVIVLASFVWSGNSTYQLIAGIFLFLAGIWIYRTDINQQTSWLPNKDNWFPYYWQIKGVLVSLVGIFFIVFSFLR